MNKKQRIILSIGIFLIVFALIYWLTQGAEIFTKTQVQVEKYDALFDTTYKEWKDQFVLGLDYAGGFSAIVAIVTGILIFIFRNKQKE